MISVSVIVPIYNGEKYITKCLDSLANQTLENIQVIMVNDGSSDNSEQVCLSYQEKYPFFEYYGKENGGSASARNVGLDHAEGEYVGFVDSDDWVELYMFEKMYRAAKKSEADIVFNTMRKAGVHYPFTWPVPGLYDRTGMGKDIFPELLPHPTESGTFRSFDWGNWSKLIRREIIEKNKIRYYEKSRRCEDLLFAFECSVNADSYLVMEHEPMYHYCPSDTSKSRHYTKNMWQSISVLMHRLDEVCEGIQGYDFKDALRWCKLYFCVMTIKNEVLDGTKEGCLERIETIIRDNICRQNIELTREQTYNKEYTDIFKAIRAGKPKKIYNTVKWWHFKKKKIAPWVAKIRK